jgi:hypothetical protein
MIALTTFSEISSAALGVAAILTAFFLAWKAVRNLAKIIYLTETYGPVLLVIGEQFKRNGGVTLKDQVDRIEDLADSAVAIAKTASDAASSSHDLVIRLDENVRDIRRRLAPAAPASAVLTAPLVVAPGVAAAS